MVANDPIQIMLIKVFEQINHNCISLRCLMNFTIYLDLKKELKSLNRELQLHILELADILVERPSQYARRVEDISLIFKNLHHLLNSLRPHQVKYVEHHLNILYL